MGHQLRKTIAFSWAEGELDAATLATNEAKNNMKSLGRDFGETLRIVEWVDAEATTGLAMDPTYFRTGRVRFGKGLWGRSSIGHAHETRVQSRARSPIEAIGLSNCTAGRKP